LAAPPQRALAADETLQLDVMINGLSIGKVGEFVLRDGSLLARREELTDLGLRVPKDAAQTQDGLIIVSSLPGVKARLDESTQTVHLSAAAEELAPTILGAGRSAAGGAPLKSSMGVTLNYDVAGTLVDGHGAGSGLFDLRVFSPLGVAWTDMLAYAGAAHVAGQDPAIRLDSTYVYSDYASQRRYWAGDYINGGLPWTRPVRLGGLQVTRDFTMRPDLVTFPLPSLAGSVAVPSTVDVFVNGTRTLSSEVQPGPFQIPQMPVVTGAGSVQLTVTNALGQQVTTTLPFYASASLLASGLHTWSVEMGFVRRNWGVLSNDYGDFAGSATYRRGLTPYLTVEAHLEGTKGQFMGGAGIVADAFKFAVVNLSAAGSTALGHSGAQLDVGVERVGRVFSFGASGIFATKNFADIAAMNGDPVPLRQISANATVYLGRWGSLGAAYAEVKREPATSLVSITGLPAFAPPAGPQPPSDVALGTTGLPFLPAESSRVLSATYSLTLGRRVFVYATGFHDFALGGGTGATIGITLPLGQRSSVTASGNWSEGSPAYGSIQAEQSPVKIGDWGYQLYLAGGGGHSTEHEFGQLQYKSPWALLTLGVDHLSGQTTPRLDAQGAFSFADGRLFATNTIYDSFAVVDTNGAGGVHVTYENRYAGRTDASGRLLVPDLQAWNVNHLAIEAGDVPIDAQVPYTAQVVRPPSRSGVVVKFPIRKTNGALLMLVDETGKPIPVGSTATLAATGVVAPVGYDGEAFIEDLGKQNQVSVQLPNDGRCTVAFPYAPAAGEIPKIGPLTCRRDDP
jgi:outer membrane usher protein